MPLSGAVVLLRQIHGGNIWKIEKKAEIKKQVEADGILVEDEGVVAGIATADCAPVVMVSGERVMVLHVSRKTLVRGLLENVTTYFEPKDIEHVYVGPHICQAHFKFEEERLLLRRFRYIYPEAAHFHRGFIHLSLKDAIMAQMRLWQVHPDKVEFDGRCTYEEPGLSSYRRWLDEGKPGELGQMHTVVWRKTK